MPVFDTQESINVDLKIGSGNVRIAASDRSDTVVEVRPGNPADPDDVEAAEQVTAEFTHGTLRVISPRRAFDFSRKARWADVSIEVPSGSRVAADTLGGEIHSTGVLGATRVKTGIGAIVLHRTGPLRADTGSGPVTVEHVEGAAEVHTGNGDVVLGTVAGSAVVKNSNGDTTIEVAGGDVRVRSANGGISVGQAAGGADVKTGNGRVLLGRVSRGSVAIESACGDLEIGVAEGTAAWLEVTTSYGKVRNLLGDVERPAESDEIVEVRGRTSAGDITVRRS